MKNSARSPSGEDDEKRGIGGRRVGRLVGNWGAVERKVGAEVGEREREGDEQTGDVNDGGKDGRSSAPERQIDRQAGGWAGRQAGQGIKPRVEQAQDQSCLLSLSGSPPWR